jgi:drug/metabolite transporter (DMT)-like permease
VFHIPLFLMQAGDQSWSGIPAHHWVYMVVAALGAMFLSNTLYYFALDRIGPSRVGMYTNLEPGFTILLAWGIGRETITAAHITGFIAIMAGIGLTKMGGNREAQRARSGRQ